MLKKVYTTIPMLNTPHNIKKKVNQRCAFLLTLVEVLLFIMNKINIKINR